MKAKIQKTKVPAKVTAVLADGSSEFTRNDGSTFVSKGYLPMPGWVGTQGHLVTTTFGAHALTEFVWTQEE